LKATFKDPEDQFLHKIPEFRIYTAYIYIYGQNVYTDIRPIYGLG